jgi:hypothetical protein
VVVQYCVTNLPLLNGRQNEGFYPRSSEFMNIVNPRLSFSRWPTISSQSTLSPANPKPLPLAVSEAFNSPFTFHGRPNLHRILFLQSSLHLLSSMCCNFEQWTSHDGTANEIRDFFYQRNPGFINIVNPGLWLRRETMHAVRTLHRITAPLQSLVPPNNTRLSRLHQLPQWDIESGLKNSRPNNKKNEFIISNLFLFFNIIFP